MADSNVLLAPSQGSISHFVLTTLPLFGLLIYFLYEAAVRPQKDFYNLGDDYTDDEFEAAKQEKKEMLSLMEILITFLVFHVLWTIFIIYILVFVPKRRHLVGRYFKEGESTLGDVIYDKKSRRWNAFHGYGYAVYPHPDQKVLVRKRVRVYQPYTRERVTILRLPGKPLSGQAKIDLEVDLGAATKDRDHKNFSLALYALFWYFFTLGSSIFVLRQMKATDEMEGYASFATKVFFLFVGLNIPITYIMNLTRFLLFRNWLTNRGALIDNSTDARKPDTGSGPACLSDTGPGSCLWDAESVDGSDVIPYSIMEEETSYQGSLEQHDLTGTGDDKRAWVTV